MAQTTYDVVEYPHRPFSQTHPDRLSVLGTMFGMQPAKPEKCRVLELGGGSGGNLIPLADLYPESTFYGVDLAETAIQAGRSRIEKLGLTNIRLDAMDVMNFPEDPGEFDFIIAHGLISWVPEPVQKRILEICSRHLAPQGIAYISYNAYPGCHIRRMWRDMMMFHTRQFSKPEDKIYQSKSMLQLVAQGTTRDDAAHQLAKEELDRRLELTDSAIFHDDLSPFWFPFYFHEFAAMAASHGLQYLSEASYSDMQPTGLTEKAMAALDSVGRSGDVILWEQYLDFFKVRRFRQTLVCRQNLPLQRTVDLKLLDTFHFSGPIHVVPVQDPNAPAGTMAFQNTINHVTVTTNNPVSVGAMTLLSQAWPASRSFAELAAVVPDVDVLRQVLHTFHSSAFLNFHASPRPGVSEAGDKPVAWRVARLEATLDNAVPHLHHGSIELANANVRKLVTLLDGTRSRADLVAMGVDENYLSETLNKMTRAGILVA
jgi:SAM-dependent methyltransferase